MTFRQSLWQIYYTMMGSGLMPPLVTMAMAWKGLTRRQLLKRILIAFGVFWAFNIIVGIMIIFGYLPDPR